MPRLRTLPSGSLARAHSPNLFLTLITAMARRLARLVYRMLKYGQQYVDKGAEYYEQRNRQQLIEFLRKKAAQLGFRITPTPA